MNWYKQIKFAIKPKPRYIQVGHNEGGFLWAVNDKWEFFSRVGYGETHYNLASYFPGPWLASGRFDPDKHIASLVIAGNIESIMYQREVIKKVSDVLKRKFGNPQVMVYDD